MTKFLHQLLLALAIFCINTFSYAQQKSSEGKEFWFGFMENTFGAPPDTFIVSLSTRINTSITIAIPLNGWTKNISLNADSTITVGIPRDIAMASGCGTTLPMGCYIKSTRDISAYALNFQSYTADASLLIPTTAIGSKYYVNTYKEFSPSSFPSQMLIIASDSNTTIKITPAVNTNCGNTADSAFWVTLHKGQVYYLEAQDDLSGTYVQSVDSGHGIKNFTLFAGSLCTSVGNVCCCDHLYDVQYYTESWGNNYILPNIATRAGTKFKVLALKDSTQISINGGAPQLLHAGKSLTRNLSSHGSLTASKPVGVIQLSFSGNVDGTNFDPFMINLGSNEQFLQRVSFNTLFNSNNAPSFYVSMVTTTADTGLLKLNDTIVGGFSVVASNNKYAVASKQISIGNHTLQSDSGFLAYVYEFATFESFGYAACANLSKLFTDTTIIDTTIIIDDTTVIDTTTDTTITRINDPIKNLVQLEQVTQNGDVYLKVNMDATQSGTLTFYDLTGRVIKSVRVKNNDLIATPQTGKQMLFGVLQVGSELRTRRLQ